MSEKKSKKSTQKSKFAQKVQKKSWIVIRKVLKEVINLSKKLILLKKELKQVNLL